MFFSSSIKTTRKKEGRTGIDEARKVTKKKKKKKGIILRTLSGRNTSAITITTIASHNRARYKKCGEPSVKRRRCDRDDAV
jgi:hypothetical protein